MAMMDPIMQMPRIARLDLSHNNLNVTHVSFRTAASHICATISKRATERSLSSSTSLEILFQKMGRRLSRGLWAFFLT
jgi:hypothetical protein